MGNTILKQHSPRIHEKLLLVQTFIYIEVKVTSKSLFSPAGKTEPELPEARRGHEGAQGVDGHPWIWKAARKQGYVTQWGEDGAAFGTFTYRMLGFTYQPVDHYMRPFYIQVGFTYRKLSCTSGCCASHTGSTVYKPEVRFPYQILRYLKFKIAETFV